MTSYHVRHDFTPTAARQVLILLTGIGATTEAQLIEHARMRDLEIGRRQSVAKVVASLRDIGLVERSVGRHGGIVLTPLGQQLSAIALCEEMLFAELIHQIYSILWSPEQGGPAFSWAYQTVANALWSAAPTTIDSSHLVSHVLFSATQQFSEPGVSFSNSSVLGILHWLRALSPSCIRDGVFSRRTGCAPEALMISLEGLYANTSRPLGVPLRLDAATRVRICQANLLEPDCLDDALSQVEETFGLIHQRGYQGEAVILRTSLYPDLVPYRTLK